VSYVNDSSEYQYGFELLASMADEVYRAEDDAGKLFLADLQEGLKAESLGLEFFIACFCENGDLLSQWRSYGVSNDVYALGFDLAKLKRMRQAARIIGAPTRIWPYTKSMLKLSYDAALHGALIREIIVAALHWTKSVLRSGPTDISAELRDVHEEGARRQVLVSANYLLAQVFTCMKDPAFQEEKEWRLVVTASTARDADGNPRGTQYRPEHGLLIPYLPIAIETRDKEFPLSSVRIGPGGPELAVRSIQTFLQEEGYSNARVESSVVPYRGW
jgi:hypothetical protein